MKTTINLLQFREAFINRGRGNQFSNEALEALYNYYTDLEDSIGEELELDVIAICCDWTEFDSEELVNEFLYLLEDENLEGEDIEELLINELRDYTIILELSDTVLVSIF